MTHGVSRRVETFEINATADIDNVASADTPVHIWDAALSVVVRNDFGAGRFNDAFVAASVIAMFMRIEDLRNRPATLFG